jgi:hypothetical protein
MAYVALPLTLSGVSRRFSDRPINRNALASLSGGAFGGVTAAARLTPAVLPLLSSCSPFGPLSNERLARCAVTVLSEYDRWAKKHPNDARMMGGFLFFRYLQKEKSDLLDFRPVGDKWQIVHRWLRDRLED